MVELSGAAAQIGKKQGNYKYWFVLQYDMANAQVQLAPLQPSGRFPTGTGNERAGRTRWKAVPEGEGKEIYVAAGLCKVVWAEVVNRVSDVDKEAWDILEAAPPHAERHAAPSGGGTKKRKREEGPSTGLAKPKGAPPTLRKQPNIPSGIPGLWNKVGIDEGSGSG